MYMANSGNFQGKPDLCTMNGELVYGNLNWINQK